MTIILKMEARGFKSFANKVEIPFGKKFNVVLGPNGSGKSNILDALSFVLGNVSAKSMRAEKSASLIFNGGKKGKPAKEAEVALYFSNDNKEFPLDTKEVKISRLLKNNGTSVYKINDEVRTRQQVLELMAAANIDPNGHNIILQGDIVKFMEMKTEERRKIIEEISGIAVFEDKKEKAMKELNKVQEKLNEADIILTEREKTLIDLKKDRDQAMKFKDLETNLKRNKATRLSMIIKEKNEKKQQAEKKVNELKIEVEKKQKLIDDFKEQISKSNEELKRIEEELDKKGDKRQREIAQRIESLRTEIIKKDSRKGVLENELKKIKERKVQLERTLKEYEENIESLKKEISNLENNNVKLRQEFDGVEKKIVLFKKNHGIEDMEEITKKISELDETIENLQREISDELERKQSLIRQKDALEYQISDLEEKLKQADEMRKEDLEKIKKVKQAKQEFANVAKMLSAALNESSVYSAQLAQARNKLMDVNDEYAKLRARSIGIKEMLAADKAVAMIKQMNLSGVYGTVAELGKVNSKYSLALEVAAGNNIKSVVVKDDAVAAKCIALLKEKKTGVVKFLPLNKLKERVIDDEAKKVARMHGAVGLAMDLVSFDPKFRNVFKYVFGPTVVVDSLNTGRKIGVGRVRMVTLEGDLLDVSGAMVGGFRRSTGMGFKEKEVDSGLESLENEIKKLQDTINLLEKKKVENEEEIINLRERKALLEAEITTGEAKTKTEFDLDELKEKKRTLVAKQKTVQEDIAAIDSAVTTKEKTLNEYREEKEKVKAKMSKISSNSVSSELAVLENNKTNIRENIIKNDSRIEGLRQQIKLHQDEKARTYEILENLNKENQEFSEEMKEILVELAELKKELGEKEKEQKQFYK
ncbi:hypothetical protein D6777_01295, partial [Candidatus Woesearchaeota archaeon]